MKKLILAILVFNLCMAEVYKPKLEDGREIEISGINEKKIYFVIRDNDRVLLSGEAYDEYGGWEGDDENGAGYDVIEYWYQNKSQCSLSLRIQDMPIDKNDKKKRISLKNGRDCASLKALEKSFPNNNELFYTNKQWYAKEDEPKPAVDDKCKVICEKCGFYIWPIQDYVENLTVSNENESDYYTVQ